MQDITEKTRIEKTHLKPPPPGPSFTTRANGKGLLAGALMAGYVMLLQIFGFDDSLALRMLKYVFLAFILFQALRTLKSRTAQGKTFKMGLGFSARLSAVAGLTFAGIHLLAFWAARQLAFDRFTMDGVDNFPTALLLAGSFILETFVAGMIIAFIYLQFYKDDKPAA